MKKLFYCILLLFFFTQVQAQNALVDSLENELLLHQDEDTTRVTILNLLCFQWYETDLDKALAYSQEAEVLAEKLDYTLGKARIIHNKASIEIMLSNYEKAINLSNQALEIYQAENNKIGESMSLNAIGMTYHYQGDFVKALDYYSRSAVIDETLNNLKDLAVSYNNIGNIYADQGNYEEAILYYSKSLAIRKKMNNYKGMAGSYNNLGSIYAEQSNLPLALEYFNKSLSIYDKLNDETRTTNLLGNVAYIYQIQGNYEEALVYLNKSLNISKQQDNKRNISQSMYNIGFIYVEQSRGDEALLLYEEALAISTEIQDQRGMSLGFRNIADLQFKRKDVANALLNYKKAHTIAGEIGWQLGASNALFGIAQSHETLDQHGKALEVALACEKIAKELEMLRLQKDVSGLLSKIYKKTGNYKKALESHEQYKILNDSLFNEENIQKMTQLEYEYKYQQELESASLREEQLTSTVVSTSQALEKSQRNYLLAIIAFLLVSMVLGLIIFYLKLRNVKATAQNIITEQKLLRSQMTPHFIFNSLSVLQGIILNKEEDKSIFYLSKFSKLLRIILENSREKTVSLQQELVAIENYLVLQNINIDPPCTYSIVVDENIDTASFNIPPMLIQPFIENATEHAFGNQDVFRELKIHLSFIHEELVCTISDNGIGVDTHFKGVKNTAKRSLATTITAERLELLSKEFNIKGSVSVVDRAKFNEQGTLVTLHIPYLKN